ncbi:hypothetical protein D3C72_1913220 [compost metagenome]
MLGGERYVQTFDRQARQQRLALVQRRHFDEPGVHAIGELPLRVEAPEVAEYSSTAPPIAYSN